MAAAFSRIVEICFVWKKGVFTISPWQYMPPMVSVKVLFGETSVISSELMIITLQFLIMAGVMFMGATEQQLNHLSVMGIDPASYINVLLSFAFFIFLYANILLVLWERLSGYDNNTSTEGYTEVGREEMHDGSSFLEDDEDEYAKEQNGTPLGSIRHHD